MLLHTFKYLVYVCSAAFSIGLYNWIVTFDSQLVHSGMMYSSVTLFRLTFGGTSEI